MNPRLIRMPLVVQVNLGCVSFSVAEILQTFVDGKQDTRFDDPTRALVAGSRGHAMTSLLFKQGNGSQTELLGAPAHLLQLPNLKPHLQYDFLFPSMPRITD